jgi:hypothetical protein
VGLTSTEVIFQRPTWKLLLNMLCHINKLKIEGQMVL